jgi:hypothetical protein
MLIIVGLPPETRARLSADSRAWLELASTCTSDRIAEGSALAPRPMHHLHDSTGRLSGIAAKLAPSSTTDRFATTAIALARSRH